MADRQEQCERVVLLLKSKNKDDNYERLFNEHGYKTIFVPVLSFKFINQKELTECLEKPEKYNGLIFTSQRAIEAVQLCVDDEAFKGKWSSSLREKWSNLPVFVTGKATGKQTREKLQFSAIFGENSGSAEALTSIISDTIPVDPNKEMLFPCANIKKETLPSILNKKGYHIQCITAYCTQADPNLLEQLQKHYGKNETGLPSDFSNASSEVTGKGSETQSTSEKLSETSEKTRKRPEMLPSFPKESCEWTRQPLCIVFFSPSGVNFALHALKQTIKSFQDVKLVPIGHSTASELEKHDLPVFGIPEKPDPQSVLKIIDSILGS